MTQPRSMTILAAILGAVLMAPRPASAEAIAWPDDFVTRLEALALVQTLNGEILASRSATLTLERWCGEHRLAGSGEATIVARLIPGEPKPATAEQLQRLEVASGE